MKETAILEKLGVPENIENVSIDIFDMFIKNLKNANATIYPDDSYEIELNPDPPLQIDDIEIKKIKITIEIVDHATNTPKIVSFNQINNLKLNRDDFMIDVINEFAEFSIEIISNNPVSIKQVLDLLYEREKFFLSSLAHEIHHYFVSLKNKRESIFKRAEYRSFSEVGLGIEEVNKFTHYMYFISSVENHVRPTEVLVRMKSENIKKKDFKEFLKNDEVWKTLSDIEKFKFEDIIEGIRKNKKQTDKIIDQGYGKVKWNREEKIKKIIEIIFISLANIKLKTVHEIMMSGKGIFGFLQNFSEDEKTVLKFLKKKILKYVNRPEEFIKHEIKHMNFQATQIKRKLSKLYDLLEENLDNSQFKIKSFEEYD